MNVLLIYFALPLATIILSIVLEKVLRCPILTTLALFAIYLVAVFAFFDATYLTYLIIYVLLAYIFSYIAELYYSRLFKKCNCQNNPNNEIELSNETINEISERVVSILRDNNCNCNCNDVVTANIMTNNGNRSTWCCRRKN